MERMRILLVDDHALFRKGVAALLAARPEVEVVGEAADGIEAAARARDTMPDAILMDIRMPRCNGLEAVRQIKQEMPHVRIVMLTVSAEDRDLFAAIKSGAEGYLLKDMEPQQLYDKLDGLRRGEAPISGGLAARILTEFRSPDKASPAAPASHQNLTQREAEVLELVATGLSNGEIASRLGITENTVKIHLRNILEKLHLQNRIQAAVYAVQQGLLRGSDFTSHEGDE